MEVKHNKLQPVNEEPNQWHCPECGTPCTIEWSGLDLVENTGDETLATKHYIPVKAETAAERDRLKEENNILRNEIRELKQSDSQKEIDKLKEENERLKKACVHFKASRDEMDTVNLKLQSINRELVEALKRLLSGRRKDDHGSMYWIEVSILDDVNAEELINKNSTL